VCHQNRLKLDFVVQPHTGKFWNLPTRKQLQVTVFCSAMQREILKFGSTKAAQIECILFTAQQKILEFTNKSNSN
jgi:hypothetical protein